MAALVAVLSIHGRAAGPDVRGWLDRYGRGQFDGVTAEFTSVKDYEAFYQAFTKQAPDWIAAGAPADRPRRELAAATFALEAARANELRDWKYVQSWMGLENIYWRSAAKFVEWGCALLRQRPTSSPIERVWQLASIAVADRAVDYEFLVGSPWDGRANPKDEILHLEHAAKRFPGERRFALNQGIAAEWRLFPLRRTGQAEAQKIFETLKDDPEVGAEDTVRLGVMAFRANNVTAALPLFQSADARTREPYVVYLARYFAGQSHERLRQQAAAEHAYRGALAATPRAQSASFALSALLGGQGRRTEAAAVIDAALTASPLAFDPWRAYGEADARFWPVLIAQLHAEIAK